MRQFYADRCTFQGKTEVGAGLHDHHPATEWTSLVRQKWIRRDRDDTFLPPLAPEQSGSTIQTGSTNDQNTQPKAEVS